jgi:hypothetical protein
MSSESSRWVWFLVSHAGSPTCREVVSNAGATAACIRRRSLAPAYARLEPYVVVISKSSVYVGCREGRTGFTATQLTPSFASVSSGPTGGTFGDEDIPNLIDATPPFGLRVR